MEKSITHYLPLSADVEIKIIVQTRFYNGIASDPRTLARQPSLEEAYQLRDAVRAGSSRFTRATTLDYPDA